MHKKIKEILVIKADLQIFLVIIHFQCFVGFSKISAPSSQVTARPPTYSVVHCA